MEKWFGKIAVVTGASAGIGEEFAKQIALQGTKVILVVDAFSDLKKLRPTLSPKVARLKHLRVISKVPQIGNGLLNLSIKVTLIFSSTMRALGSLAK